MGWLCLRCGCHSQRSKPITAKSRYHEKLEKARSLKRSGKQLYGDEREVPDEPYRTARKVKKLGAAVSVHGPYFRHLVSGATTTPDARIRVADHRQTLPFC